VGNIPVRRMVFEKLRLVVERILHALFRVDVLLATVDDTDETEFKRVNASGEDLKRVGAGIHEVEFG